MVVELKAEYPGISLGEMATICYVRIGRRLGKHTIERVLSEEPVHSGSSACLSRLRIGH
jgi:hypothetical protein